MNYNNALLYIDKIVAKGSILGLDRIKTLMGLLGNPENELNFIHVAGTNGKGSVAAYTQSILTQAGYKTGLFTSPHIERVNERIQIDGQPIKDSELSALVEEVGEKVEEMVNKPTEFEFYTAMAILYFAKNECDYVVLEVGLGGEYDSTNIIPSPVVACITNIGLDHTAELGNSLEEIAATKSKIIKEGTNVVLSKQEDEITKIIEERCKEVDAELFISEPEKLEPLSGDIEGQSFGILEFGEIKINSPAAYQLENCATAFKIIEVLNSLGAKIKPEAVIKGFKKTYWPGRFEVILKKPDFIVDGSHNPEGIKATKESLERFFGLGKTIIIMGVMKDKDYNQMVDIILPVGAKFFTVAPNNQRALDPNELKKVIEGKGGEAKAFKTVSEAVKEAVETAKKENLNVCAIGSLYMVGDIKKIVKDNFSNDKYAELSVNEFISKLASDAPTPGGGGAAALAGALAMALGNMVASLTLNSKKYAFAKKDMLEIKDKANEIQNELLDAIDQDAENFKPLIEAYKLPSDTDKEKMLKQMRLDKCTIDACQTPLQIMKSCCAVIELVADLADKGSRMALSDAGCAAALAKAALQAASLNIFINTKSMRYRDMAIAFNDEANQMLKIYGEYADKIYNEIKDELNPPEEVTPV